MSDKDLIEALGFVSACGRKPPGGQPSSNVIQKVVPKVAHCSDVHDQMRENKQASGTWTHTITHADPCVRRIQAEFFVVDQMQHRCLYQIIDVQAIGVGTFLHSHLAMKQQTAQRTTRAASSNAEGLFVLDLAFAFASFFSCSVFVPLRLSS